MVNIGFSLKFGSPVSGKIFDQSGRTVQSIETIFFNPGFHTIALGGSGLSTGAYYIQVKSGLQSETCRVTVIK